MSLNLNKVILAGHLTAQPELRQTPNGVSVTSFSIAINRRFSRSAEGNNNQAAGANANVDFINCVAWRNTAEFISRYFRKGQRIALQGSLQTRKYTANDGSQRTAFDVVVDNAFFCESKGGNAGGAPSYDSQIPVMSEARPAFSTANAGDFEEILTDEDLPF